METDYELLEDIPLGSFKLTCHNCEREIETLLEHYMLVPYLCWTVCQECFENGG